MDNLFASLTSNGIKKIQPYHPGKPIGELKREFGLKRIIKLASNENPLGPSPKALEAIKNMDTSILAHYPDSSGHELKEALTKHLQVSSDQLILGNGSEDNLAMIARTFLRPGDDAIIPQYSFKTFSMIVNAADANIITAPAKLGQVDVEEIIKAVTSKTKLILIANPNNPLPTWINSTDLEHMLSNIPQHVMVVADEAYYEYINNNPDYPHYPDTILLQQQYPSLITTRTFSKVYGLAGLRIGYSISHPDVAQLLNRVRSVFNANSIAQAAAIAALGDADYVQHSLDSNRQGLRQLETAFAEMGLSYIASATNFITVNINCDAQRAFEFLLSQGVIVRPMDKHTLGTYLRISVGTTEENDFFLNCLHKMFEEKSLNC